MYSNKKIKIFIGLKKLIHLYIDHENYTSGCGMERQHIQKHIIIQSIMFKLNHYIYLSLSNGEAAEAPQNYTSV